MIAGHFGLAAGVKAWVPRLPLWALMLGTFLLDVVFVFFSAAGLETLTPADPARPTGYGSALIQAYYTHSLVGALLIAAAAGALGGWRWGRRAGWMLGAVVFSHWLLDLVVHRPDLPILPGNAGNLPLLGLGLWTLPAAAATIEFLLIAAGAYLYFRAASALPAPSSLEPAAHKRRVLTAAGVTAVLLLLLLVFDVLGM